MNIGIDARLWNETGVGRYIRALVSHLGEIDNKHNFTLFLNSEQYTRFSLPNKSWKKILADIKWHTFFEQMVMPFIYKRANLDLLHVPYFSVPIVTQIPLVVTIHDLTISRMATGKATTRALPIYWFKRLGYKLILSQAINKSYKIITVSHTVKDELLQEFSIDKSKILVTYESGELEKDGDIIIPNIPQNYVLYVGNAHPHKNLSKLVHAWKIVLSTHLDYSLVMIGGPDYFYNQLSEQVNHAGLQDQIIFTGSVTPSELIHWYKKATCFVFPSLSEGFGIPGLEAMSVGCPVAASQIPVFGEIYGDAATYFNPHDEIDIASCLNNILKNKKFREELLVKGKKRARKYSWRKMAKQTLAIYESCFGL